MAHSERRKVRRLLSERRLLRPNGGRKFNSAATEGQTVVFDFGSAQTRRGFGLRAAEV